ncbi:MAG: hypothetical protein ACTHKZ_02620 [Lysobacteraceae bacterium]
MKSFLSRHERWIRRLAGIATMLLLLALWSHPELRLLVPLFDAAGLDLLFTLLGVQALAMFADIGKPFLVLLWRRCAPALTIADGMTRSVPLVSHLRRFGSYLLFSGCGHLGQYAWIRLAAGWAKAIAGPGAHVRAAFPRG